MFTLLFQDAFELMAVIAVMTNCALIGLSAQVQAQVPALGLGVVIMVIVAAEVGTGSIRIIHISIWYHTSPCKTL